MEFAHPKLLYLLLILIPLAAWYFFRRKRTTANLQISTTEAFMGVGKSYKYYLLHLPFILRMGVIALLIIVLARPQSSNNWSDKDVEGIDIVMAMDISGSMIAEDLKPNRLEAAKSVGVDFISSRPNDNIGIVVFAGESFTLSPMTTDKASLVSLMNNVSDEMIDADGTAIGMGLANAVNRIKDSQAKSRVIILLTDGSNNRGEVDPLTAADLAKTYNIRVYTIGVGTKGLAPYPVRTVFGIQRQNMKVDIDEKTLQAIADKTNGKYFRATDNKTLKAIYAEIDQMEKTKIQVTEYTKKQEEFLPYAICALLLLLLEVILRNTVLRHIP
ncbi:MAG: VWA domain-containing protein [Paludibacteraceae bacterium]|nr:VWA domain-containing protein [Paludibacteraceae bacterium]MBR5971995.1 VWA domain-containing protein [Paludibacteraceae bacterium]